MLQLAPDLAVHLESPLALPHGLTQVAISGWIVCRRPIGQVEIQPGRQSLTLIDRPDVKAVYPDYPYVSGYIGIVPAASLASTNTLMLAFDVEGSRHTQGFRLDEKHPLSDRQSLDTALHFLRLVNGQLREVDIHRQHVDLLSTPLDVNLEATNRCNLACPTCARNYWDKGKNPIGDMKPGSA